MSENSPPNMLLPVVTPENSTDPGQGPMVPGSSNTEDEDTFAGPITRSRAKAHTSVLACSNTVMEEHFDDDTGGPTTVFPCSVYHLFDPRRGWNTFFSWFK